MAIEYYWYVAFPPLDIFIHFLGGDCIALSVLYVFKENKYIIPLTIVAGICWEIFEVYFGIAGHPFGTYLYNIDTVKDLIMDTLGAVAVYYINRKK